MLTRPKFPRPKTMLIVTDFPINIEIQQDIPYSATSNLKVLNELHKTGIRPSDYSTTYLSFTRPGEDDFDWYKSFAKLENLEPMPGGFGLYGELFYKLEHQKDCYVIETLWNEFQGLLQQIREVNPKIIIVAGKWSLFFLSGKLQRSKIQGSFKDLKALAGLGTYRASMLPVWEGFNLPDALIVPLLPPTTAYRMPDKVPLMTWDYRKVGVLVERIKNGESISNLLHPNNTFVYGCSFQTYVETLEAMYKSIDKEPTLVSVDKETRHNVTDCIGLSIKAGTGVCIPFATLDTPLLWSLEEEVTLTNLILKILKHPNARLVGQSFAYDVQYIYRHWLTKVNATVDTMVLHHVLYNYMKKSLDVLASIYCDDYIYWKDMQTHGK